jgi:hypothetical protein
VTGFNIVSMPNNTKGQFCASFKANSITQLANNGTNYANWTVAGTGTTKGATGIHLVANASTDRAYLSLSLKPSTQYTLVYDVVASNLDGNMLAIGSTVFNTDTTLAKTVGKNKVLFTTPATILSNINDIRLQASCTDGTYIDLKNIMLFEGDQTANPVAYDHYLSYGAKSTLSFRAKSNNKNILPTNSSAWEQGSLGPTGVNTTSTIRLRSKGYYNIESGVTYKPSTATGYSIRNVFYFDNGMNFISASSNDPYSYNPIQCGLCQIYIKTYY